MMNGYNKQDALAFILPKVNRKEHSALSDKIDDLISQAIDADMKFMEETGVIDADGNAGDSYYEDDDAFEYMVEALVSANQLTPEQAVKVASLIDDYMDLQQAYMESVGLVEWD